MDATSNRTSELLQGLNARVAEARSELERRGELFVEQARAVSKELSQRQAIALGAARDQSVALVYTNASRALGGASQILGAAPSLAPISRGQERLDGCSRHWQRQHDALFAPPVSEYDELNVKQVNAAIAELDVYSLVKTRDYEAANKNRVTVLREIDRLLAA